MIYVGHIITLGISKYLDTYFR